jgi:ABC-2 type transport system permease protein
MSALWIAYRAELMKLRRTLALTVTFAAPAAVVGLQMLIWLRNSEGFGVDMDLWLSFLNNVLAMWGLFMYPLLAALVAALIYHLEHASTGWLRIFTWPLPRWVVPAAKLSALVTLLTVSSAALLVGSLAGAWLVDLVHPKIELPQEVPLVEMAWRAGKVFAAGLLVVAIQNFVSLWWPSMTLSLGVAVVGTFVGLFASSWKLGVYYPWLIPLRTLYGRDDDPSVALAVGVIGGVVVLTGTLVAATRRDPGLYQ